jgi:hypothetical protein
VIYQALAEAKADDSPITDPAAIAQAAGQLAPKARDSHTGNQSVYELLADAASFLAKVQSIDAMLLTPLEMKDHDIKDEWVIKDGTHELGTMALRQSMSNPLLMHICYIVRIS